MPKAKESTAMYPVFIKEPMIHSDHALRQSSPELDEGLRANEINQSFLRVNQRFLNLKKGAITFLLLATSLLAACSYAPEKRTSTQDPQQTTAVEMEFRQALALMQAKDMQAAAEKLHDLIEHYPQMTGAWANLGLIHMKAGEWEKARHSLQQAISLNPNHAPVYNYLGVVYRNLGQFKESEQAYKKAIDIDPGYAIVWLNLGILYDIYMDKPAQALPQYEQYQHLNANADSKVRKWIVELKRRIPKKPKPSDTTGGKHNG